MKKLTVLFGLAMALALALPGSAEAVALIEVKKIIASDAQAADLFGGSVAVSGDTAVVGAFFEDAGGTEAGAAYVFQRDEGGADNWGEVQKLTASDAQAGDFFGISVAISGDTAIVGAFFEDAGGTEAGAAYVFQRDEGGPDSWGEVQKLTASDAQASDEFGISVAISGDTAIVGAFQEAPGGIAFAGAAYLFERNQGGPDNWGEVKKLTASDAQGGRFGHGVSLSGDTAIVGALAARVGGSGGFLAGAAYLFERNQGGPDNWGEVTKLTASDAQSGDSFGISVAMGGDTAVVGALEEDAGGRNAGAAYVFERNQGGPDNWGEVKKLTASDAEAFDFFGISVAVSGDRAIVGAYLEDAGGVGFAAGGAYVFERDQDGPGTWGEVTKLTASDAQAEGRFGISVALSGDRAIVGALFADAGRGAAYVLQAPPPTEQININVVEKLSGGKLEGTCWRISYISIDPIYPVPVKIPHDVVGDDVTGVRPDCGEPSNVKLSDKDPSAGNLRITITSAQRVQYGDIWHAQMSFSPISGGLDPTNYECDLSLGKCTIGPVAVGGLVVDLEEGPLAAAQPSGGGAGRLAGTVAGVAALAVTLTGAAWYARRRLHSPTAP